MNALAQALVAPSQPQWSKIRCLIAPSLDKTLAQVATSENLSERSLKSVALLHLPQFPIEQLTNKLFLYNEVAHIAQRIKALQSRFEDWVNRENVDSFNRHEFRTTLVPEQTAQDLHIRFHYLHSAHAGESIGIYHETDPVPTAMVTLSPMNVTVLQKYVTANKPENARLLSRMFAFEWAPRNSISYLLGQLTQWMKQCHPNVDTFLTFVNPNVEFTGSSYRASNWELIGTYPTQYRYFEGEYISARMFHELGNTASEMPQISFAQYELSPLEIWAHRIRK